jgi:oligoendopeptidase F
MPQVKTVPHRSDIPAEHKWNAESVFETPGAWEQAAAEFATDLQGIDRFRGHLADGPAVLADWFDLAETLVRKMGKLMVYASMTHACDTTDPAGAAMTGRVRSLAGRFAAGSSFVEPELLAIGRDTLAQWAAGEPRLAIFAHYFNDLFRQQAHVRSAEVEEVLGLATETMMTLFSTADTLANAELKFAPALDDQGRQHEVTQGTLAAHLRGPDRTLRRTAYESYTDSYLAFQKTFASNLSAALKRDVFHARARRYDSALEAALFRDNIPTEVFHNLIDTFRRNLPTWHRYWDIRRRALGVDAVYPYDVWAPLTDGSFEVSFEQAVDWISAGMTPLGSEYVDALRQGCLADRWVDRYPNVGKQQGAFSAGRAGTMPFIKMSYLDDIGSMSTLAHELGHSMHSYFTWRSQPVVYTGYTMFLAETASNFNQAMTRAYLLDTSADTSFLIAVIEEAMSNLHRYFFIMPTLARWELDMHQRVEHGEPLTAPVMNARMTELFAEGYGSTMQFDPDRVGITWATFQHMYMNFYVYSYSTGISAAHALANRVLSGDPGAAEAYLGFLKAGDSAYSLDILREAGVDMATPAPVEETFGVLASYVDRLEKLLGV